ncbi:MAG: hypothetical protein QXY21_01795, partial [Candidatus Micrarchaeaceae archaeon]
MVGMVVVNIDVLEDDVEDVEVLEVEVLEVEEVEVVDVEVVEVEVVEVEVVEVEVVEVGVVDVEIVFSGGDGTFGHHPQRTASAVTAMSLACKACIVRLYWTLVYPLHSYPYTDASPSF